MLRLVGLLACLLASPAFAQCVTLPPEDFAQLDWGSAERFDQGEALMLMAGMMDAPVAFRAPRNDNPLGLGGGGSSLHNSADGTDDFVF